MELNRDQKLLQAEKIEPTADDLQQWQCNWIWRAVQTLAEAADFNSSPKWISKRLNISIEKAVDALEGLERLGYLERQGNIVRAANSNLQIRHDNSPIDRERLLLGHTKLSPIILSKLKAEDSFTSQFFIGNKELVREFAPKFIKLYEQMNEVGRERGLTDVMASEISFVQLTTSEIGGVQ